MLSSGAVMFPEMYGDDPYDIDKGWRPRGYVWALEGTKGGPVREFGNPPNHDDYMMLEDEFKVRTIDFIRATPRRRSPSTSRSGPRSRSFLGFPDRVTATREDSSRKALARIDTLRIGRADARS